MTKQPTAPQATAQTLRRGYNDDLTTMVVGGSRYYLVGVVVKRRSLRSWELFEHEGRRLGAHALHEALDLLCRL